MAFTKRIVLYGPPAVGKSTLLRMVTSIDDERLKHAIAIDLENIPITLRPRAVHEIFSWNAYGPLLVGAAELFPPVYFPWKEWRIVGLIPNNKEAYLERVERRNKENPGKANQNESKAYDDIKNHVNNNLKEMACVLDPLEYENEHEKLWLKILDSV